MVGEAVGVNVEGDVAVGVGVRVIVGLEIEVAETGCVVIVDRLMLGIGAFRRVEQPANIAINIIAEIDRNMPLL